MIVIGGGVGGLTLALALHRAGVPCAVYEAVPEIKGIGVGINLLPHAMRELDALGVMDALAAVAIETEEAAFYNRFGQHIYTEPLGRYAGYPWPQLSIHRGDLQMVLLAAVRERIGAENVHAGRQCVRVDQDERGVTVTFADAATGAESAVRGAAAIGCDGIRSAVRKQLHPDEGEPRYSGVNMWRGVTVWEPVLSGATFVRAGWLAHGKLVLYPIRDRVDAQGRQLLNWVAEIETPHHTVRDWNRRGSLDDFIGAFADWHFDWCDVPALMRASETILEYPMVDQDPLPWWTRGRITLLGDAAHPMVPRGSNGAGQATVDAHVLAAELKRHGDDVPEALRGYEAIRLPATANVVLTNRRNPPDAILRIVHERTGDRPFERIDEVVSREELVALTDSYKRVAGYDRETLGTPAS
ncbi:MAG TPA: flavin-dependent oxidoreductase [Candidatus Baltobacteraceae bacterium]|nr:flavin-dependent oxidoreductase [Candidatus Baltobacteraceae bacterium]